MDDDEDDDVAPAKPQGTGFLDMDLGSGTDDEDNSFAEGDDGEEGGGGDDGSGDDEAGDFDSGSDAGDDGDVVSACSGDDPAALGAEPPPIDEINEQNIVEGPRKRARVDYAVLNAALSDDESDDGGAFYGSKAAPAPADEGA